ncbi:hypothetical protein ACTI_60550 [Actinoplanes sp. OR16]|uniref:hypothetical protein n=1 Tax=Actinoplanes sp. OR16 TaxID=946334 RepID=UPI000F70D471|nr:hypothetical protein [Actinoplanes sp. OR16]BBH69370.1 hypothetical protein ACTI_60550 [Actinoplanes sp. OR16]
MTEPSVVVERCVVRVLRRGGWSWGPHPRDLPPGLAELLAGLIATRFRAELAADTDVEITEPVRIAVRLPLRALYAAPRDRLPTPPSAEAAGLDAGMPESFTVAPEPTGVAAACSARLPGRRSSIGRPSAVAADRLRPDPDLTAGERQPPLPYVSAALPAVALARLLAAVRAGGALDDLLRALPAETLDRYAAMLTPPPDAQHRSGSAHLAESTPDVPVRHEHHLPDPAVPEPARSGPLRPADAADRSAAPETPRLRLAAAAQIAATAGDDDRALAAALTERFGPPAEPSPASTSAFTSRVTSAIATPRPAGPLEVRSALPFLVAAALHRIGVLEQIGAALAGAGLAADAPLFATALAYQTLGPLERGWRRHPTDQQDAAVFAGRLPAVAEPGPHAAGGNPGLVTAGGEPDLVAFARRARSALPLADALLGLAVAGGHQPGRPLVAARTADEHGGGLLLAEADGAFPIAWTDSPAGLLPGWRAAGQPFVLLAGPSIGAATIRALTAAGVPLLAAFPPTRDERWRRLPGRRRLWTTAAARHADAAPARLDPDAIAETMSRQTADAASRSAVPLDGGRDLLRTVTLAAGIGLATIAWQLWGANEPTDAPLTVERFGDLSAVVTSTPDAVHVRLPLGRRHADLDHSGMLADVPAFWLDGRTLLFSGG